MEFKICGICGKQKEIIEFHKMKNGYQYSCKECKKRYQKGIRVMKDTSKYLKCEKLCFLNVVYSKAQRNSIAIYPNLRALTVIQNHYKKL